MTREEQMAYFASMPRKEKTNPYWELKSGIIVGFNGTEESIMTMSGNKPLLNCVRQYFRNVYHSFHTEAQVLCVAKEDAGKLEGLGIPKLSSKNLELCKIPVDIFVLPQQNTAVNSTISEWFWQEAIVSKGIIPVARIHSHHILEAYQSATDYSTLNSNSLEMVMGRIEDDLMQVAFWLDKHGTDTKATVIRVTEIKPDVFDRVQIPCGKRKTSGMVQTRK